MRVRNVLAWLIGSTLASPLAAADAEWTVMVFMSGDNNLDRDAVEDLVEMTEIGSTPEVNVVVQMDRAPCKAINCWSKTLRRVVAREGLLQSGRLRPPAPEELIGEVNMGEPQALRAFVEWARLHYPARREALIVWGHGQGWRPLLPARAADLGVPYSSAFAAAYRSSSSDDTDADELHNSELVEALAPLARQKKFDLLGFDTCLMSMVETAYTVRDLAHVMVSSEELEPAEGWRYDHWLPRLQAAPAMSTEAFGTLLVDSYVGNYPEGMALTLAAVRLERLREVAEAVSRLAERMIVRLPDERAAFAAARDGCEEYAPNIYGDGVKRIHHVDVACLAERIREASASPEVGAAAAAVAVAIRSAVIHESATPSRRGRWVSKGLAIYFPRTRDDYQTDPFAEGGYDPDNDAFPVAFVKDFAWSRFLQRYWSAQ